MSSRSRRVIASLLTLCAAAPCAAALTLATAAPAAASSYRYWTYWWGRPDRTSWQYASLGPASDSVSDGWVLGWRFQVTSPTGGGAQAPRTSFSYSDLCSDAAPGADQVRVAVVVDYGDATIAPPGENPPGGPRAACVVVPAHSHGSDVMRAASVSLRVENGFVCGIDGYPSVGCATAVDATPSPTPSTTSSTTSTPTSRPTSKPTPSATATSGSSAHTRPTPAATQTPSSAATQSATSTASTSGGTQSQTPQPTESVTSIASTGAITGTTARSSPSSTTTPVGTVIATAPTKVTESRNALGLVAGIAGIALLAGSAWFTSRRRGGTR